MSNAWECSLCGGRMKDAGFPADWPGLASDNRPWPTAGPVAICSDCGHVQKACTPEWRADVARVYADYALYHLSDGVEQVLFSDDLVETKSARLIDRFAAEHGLADTGRLLDVGCGGGSLLRAFAARRPAWRLHGHEQDDRGRDAILAQPGVEGFHTGSLAELNHRFDLVTIVHVFEHVFEPAALLASVRDTLAPGGAVLIQVPDLEQNPFDLTVVDHRSHFSTECLVATARAAGYLVEIAANDWITKEITLVLTEDPVGACVSPVGRVQPATPKPRGGEGGSAAAGRDILTRSLAWLQEMVGYARHLGNDSQGFGIFGTANAATWLASVPGVHCAFFVDEDANKVGKAHLGRPIYAPDAAPAYVPVLLAFPPEQALAVGRRLEARAPHVSWCLPPALLARGA